MYRWTRTLLLVALFGASCEASCERDDALLTRAVVVGQASDPESLDPGLTTSSEAAQILAQIFEPLVRHEAGGGIKPCLATRWEVSPDGTRWVFHLRQDVHFHDGTLLDADAVVFSFERQRDPTHPFYSDRFAYWRTTFGHIVHTRKIDHRTVEVRTQRPFAPFLGNLAMFPVSIVSPAELRRGAASPRPVGTGPYRFRSWRRGSRVVLDRNPSYWGGPPRIPRLVFAVVREERRRLSGLQSGTIDMIYGVNPEDRPIVQLHPDLHLLPAGAANVAYLAFNTQRAPFDDVRVRRAINHAINKSLIIKLGFQGLAKAASGPIPPELWGFAPDVRRYDYDPVKARALLNDAGFVAGRRFRLHVMTTPRPYLPSPVLVARIVAQNLKVVGIDVDVISQPHAEHIRALRRGEHDLGLLGWVTDTGDPDNFLYVLLDSDNAQLGSAQNVAFFRHPALHALLAAARQEMRREVRAALYRRAQILIAEQAPWVPLTHAEVAIAVGRALRGVGIDPTNTLDFRRVAF